MKKFIFGLMAAVALSASVSTAKAEVEVSGNVDLVSASIWRGTVCGGASLQPAVSVSVAGFTLSGWASQTLTGDTQSELDFTLDYSIGGFTVAYTNYWWTGMEISGVDTGYTNYFQKGAHISEVAVSYEISESFPLSLSWSTMVAGKDLDADGDQAFSTYIEVAYPFEIKEVECAASVGITPWTGMYSGDTEGFQVASVALTASKDLLNSDKFSLPLFVTATFAPTQKDAYLVAGLSFGF